VLSRPYERVGKTRSQGLTIWLFKIAMENHIFFIGKPSINGPFSMAMLNNKIVIQSFSSGEEAGSIHTPWLS